MRPEMWGFFGTVVTGMFLILGEVIRGRRRTEDVVSTGLEELRKAVCELDSRLDDHLDFHLRNAPTQRNLRRK